MKYFIDFEASKYSQRIISVGCVDENNREFYSLVNSDKLTEEDLFTEVTGITPADMEDAPTADVVFEKLYDWINADEEAVFFCYGDCDTQFAKNTLKDISSFKAECMLCFLSRRLHNFAIDTAVHFKIKQPIGLIKVVNYYREEEIIQVHNSLEDAKFLKEIYYKEQEEEIDTTPFPDYDKGGAFYEATKPKPYVVASSSKSSFKYRNINRAVNFLLSKSKTKLSEEHYKSLEGNTRQKLKNAIKNQKLYYGYIWKYEDR